MRLRVDDISFESPQGLEDCTSYNFRAANPKEELAVRLEFPAGGGTPSDAVIAKVHAQLDNLPVPGFAVEQPVDRQVAGVPGKSLHYDFDEKGEPMHGVVVVANLGSETHANDWINFRWMLGTPRARVDARIDTTLASLARVDQPAPAPTPAGWVRRHAGVWAFDVPASLSYPRTYSWQDLATRLAVSITVTKLDADPPVIDEPLLDASNRGEIVVDRKDLPLKDGALMRVHLRDDELGADHFVCRAVQRFEFAGPAGAPARACHVKIDATGPFAEEARLRALVDELLASVRKEQSP
jgi:hypothetical protein